MVGENFSALSTTPSLAREISPIHKSTISNAFDRSTDVDLISFENTQELDKTQASNSQRSVVDPAYALSACVKGPISVYTRRRIERDEQRKYIVIHETIDVIGSNCPVVERVVGYPLPPGINNRKNRGREEPKADGDALLSSGIVQIQFSLQLPAKGSLDFLWDQQFSTVEVSPLNVAFANTLRPLANLTNDLARNFEGPVNMCLHLHATREERPEERNGRMIMPTPGKPNTLIRNAIEIRFDNALGPPTTELRKKPDAATGGPGVPHTRERVFLGDGVIRLDRDMLILPHDALNGQIEETRCYELTAGTSPTFHRARRLSSAPYDSFLLSTARREARRSTTPPTPIVQSPGTPRISTGSILTDSSSSINTAVTYDTCSPMNSSSRCPTAASPSLKTAYSRDSLFGSASERCSRSPVQKVRDWQNVSARTGVSVDRLQKSKLKNNGSTPSLKTCPSTRNSASSSVSPYHSSVGRINQKRTSHSRGSSSTANNRPGTAARSRRDQSAKKTTEVQRRLTAAQEMEIAGREMETAGRKMTKAASEIEEASRARSNVKIDAAKRKMDVAELEMQEAGRKMRAAIQKMGKEISKEVLGSISQKPLLGTNLNGGSRDADDVADAINKGIGESLVDPLDAAARPLEMSTTASVSYPPSTFSFPVTDSRLTTPKSVQKDNRLAKRCHRRQEKPCKKLAPSEQVVPKVTAFKTDKGFRVRVNLRADLRQPSTETPQISIHD